MNLDDLKAAILEAIQRDHGYTQYLVGETIIEAIEKYLSEQGKESGHQACWTAE